MKAGQITAKIRDAVPVCFYQDGDEAVRYRNIDIPDSLKDLDIMDFGFDISADGKITFRLFFEDGTLPAEFPPIREKFTRAEKAAAKAAKNEIDTADLAEAAAEVIAAVTGSEVTVTPADADEPADTPEDTGEAPEPEQPASPEYRFNVSGAQRKALVAAIGEYLDQKPEYLGAPSFAFTIGEYRIDKTGAMTGEATPELLATLAEQDFIPEAK